MVIADIHEAKSRLSRLVEQALKGEDVVITRAGGPVVRLVPVQVDTSPRLGGQWKGRVAMANDFETLPDDLDEAFGMMDL